MYIGAEVNLGAWTLKHTKRTIANGTGARPGLNPCTVSVRWEGRQGRGRTTQGQQKSQGQTKKQSRQAELASSNTGELHGNRSQSTAGGWERATMSAGADAWSKFGSVWWWLCIFLAVQGWSNEQKLFKTSS